MSEQKPIKPADLARHWGCSPAYITKLVKTRQMPAFVSTIDADAWRAINAPPRKLAMTSLKIGSDDSKKIGDSPDTTTLPNKTPKQSVEGSAPNIGGSASGGGNIIDVKSFIRPGVDFDALMLEHAEGVPQVAHGLYLRACARGNPNEIAAQLKNWNDAADAAANVRERFLEIQEKARTLIPLDEVMDVIGTELQAWRAAMLKLGMRNATAANPADPALAQRVIDEAVDRTFQKIASAFDDAREKLGAAAISA